MKWIKRRKENEDRGIWEDPSDTFSPTAEHRKSPFDTGAYFKDYGEDGEKNWAEDIKGEFSKWIHPENSTDVKKEEDDFSDTMPQAPIRSFQNKRKMWTQDMTESDTGAKKSPFTKWFLQRESEPDQGEEDFENWNGTRMKSSSYSQKRGYEDRVASEQRWEESETRKSAKRDFPSVYGRNWQWLLAFVVTFSSMLITPLLVAVFHIHNPYLSVSIMSGIALLGLLILHPLLPFQLFRPLRKADALIVVGGTIVTILMVTVAANYFEQMGFKTAENPVVNLLVKGNMLQLFVVSWIQFIAEEIYFALPFLFVFEKTKSLPRVLRIFLALVVSSLIFGGLHLSTYSFNFLQSFLMIGFVRVLLSITYLWTKNLTVSYLVHGLYDWILLMLAYYATNYGALPFLS